MSAKRAHTTDAAFADCARSLGAERDYVHRALRRHGVRPDDVPDLAQEVFLITWRNWASFDASRALRPWLAGIAFKVARGHRRRSSQREIASDTLDPAASAPGPEDQLIHARARAVLMNALERLPDKSRSVLVLHDLEGMTARDIAVLVDLPRFTVHSRLRRARLALEKLVRQIEQEPRFGGRAGKLGLTALALLALERNSTAAVAQTPLPGQASRFGWGARWLWVGVVAVSCLGLFVVGRKAVERPVSPPPAPAPEPTPRSRAAAFGAAARALAIPMPDTTAAPMSPARAAAAGPTMDAGLVGHWSFDDRLDGGSARDLSGRGHDCQLHGRDPATASQAGRAGGAVNLGTKGWLECPQPAPAPGPVAMTVALWANRARVHTASTLVDRYRGPGTEVDFHFAFRGSTLTVWSHLWSRTTTYELEAPPQGWVHLAFTHARHTTKIFMDGTLVVQRDDTPAKAAASAPASAKPAPMVVGALVRGPSQVWQHFDGAIDELRLYDRALSDQEIEALALQGRHEPTTRSAGPP